MANFTTEPADGLPPVVATDDDLRVAADAIATGDGPVALDAERASGYRYFPSAYLIQLRRAGAGTMLIDPTTIDDFGPLAEVLSEPEWILHAASQDLPCLAEVGLTPASLFDTELAARLLGLPRVGLGGLLEDQLGVHLQKQHSAADWSKRPLPADWLNYAALDVEYLVELRERLVALLAEQGKLEWAAQEFHHVRNAPAAPPRTDPWRRTTGLHALRKPHQQLIVRELWFERDSLARQRDIAPGRVLPDSAIVAAAAANPRTVAELTALDVFRGPRQRKLAERWFSAIRRGAEADPALARRPKPEPDFMPPPRAWGDRRPDAAARLARARQEVASVAEEVGMPAENVLPPEALKRICWSPPSSRELAEVRARLSELGARPWQVDLCAEPIRDALQAQPEDGVRPSRRSAQGASSSAD